MSSTLSVTTSQPRSLLSIARLNIARSRVLPSNCSLLRIDQMSFGRNGGLAPVSFPLFQAKRPVVVVGNSVCGSCMAVLLCFRGRPALAAHTWRIVVYVRFRANNGHGTGRAKCRLSGVDENSHHKLQVVPIPSWVLA